MPRSQAVCRQSGFATLLLVGMLLLAAPVVRAAASSESGAVISGMVRDAQGTAQMGALVQVLTTNSTLIATAFTDTHGRYRIANLHPGQYLVRASAALLVPATRANLQLRTTAVVNLTLGALFDTASWLPAERRRADEPEDEWKWTLRSTANRPILRIMEDGRMLEVSSSASEHAHAANTSARATVTSGDGEFGAGGLHNILSIHRMLDDGSDMLVRADIGSSRVQQAYGPPQEIEAGYELREGFDGAARTVVSYKTHPELVAAGAAPGAAPGLQSLSVLSSERMNIGELLEIEAGGAMDFVNSSEHTIAAHPFVRLTTHPMGVWTLHYRMASDRGVQGFEDVTTGGKEIPVALVRHGKLELEQGRHQETSVDRRIGPGTVSLAFYHDHITRAAVAGGGAAGPDATLAGRIPTGMLADPTTGSFRALAAGYTSNGARFTVSTPLRNGLWVAAEYSMGRALESETGGLASFADSLAAMQARGSQSATIAFRGHIQQSGTRLRTSYRWQPSSLVTAVDPYSDFSEQAFFSCQLRQPIRWAARLPKGLDATIDVTNLLAEGYRPFLSADGQTLYFAQAPRTLQAGLSFSF